MKRQRRALGAGVLVVIVAVVLIAALTTGSPTKKASASKNTKNAAASALAHQIPAVESGLLPWQLSAPLSRSVVLPSTGSAVTILGGLTSSNASAEGVYDLDTSNGHLTHVANLATGTHDAAGALINGQDVVFGGGASKSFNTVQAVNLSPKAAGGIPTASAIGTLPGLRSDLATTTIGSTTYLIGGYDGTNADPEVLATTDGHTFTNVAALPVPVRYPAVAALNGVIYVMGGQGITRANANKPVDDVQKIDPQKHSATVVGHLPTPVQAASAMVLDGHIYLAGGDTDVPQNLTPGVGTTQLKTSGPNTGVGATGASTTGYTTGGTNAVLTAATVSKKGSGSTSSTPSTAPPAPTKLSSVDTIWALNTTTLKVQAAGRLQVPVSNAGVTVVGKTGWLVGGESNGSIVGAVQMITPNLSFGTAGALGAGSPYFGSKLLIADRGNNRMLLMDAAMNLLWSYPNSTSPANQLGFYFPDDAFFIDHGKAIISNQEENETIVEIAYPSGKILWSYGHAKQTGTAAGFLHEPDDAYLLANGQISVADADNCRVLILNQKGTVAHQIGTNGVCSHKPPTSMGSPNGDTPLYDGNILVSEINGSWVTEYTPVGKEVWTVHLPIAYPSDPQQLGASPTNNADHYLIADYSKPGQILQFNREGQILTRYDVSSGPGMLDHPSLAEMLPNGMYLVNDDYNNRMVAIDPANGALVWQYGITGHAGTAPGMLNTPDGFDILLPNGTTPTHPQTG